MIRFRISKFLDFVSHKKRGFHSIQSDCKFEDTHGLIPNIELRCIDTQREGLRVPDHIGPSEASSNKETECSAPNESDIVPPRCIENRVYSSPSEDIVGYGGGDHFGQFFNPKSIKRRQDESSVMLINESLGESSNGRKGNVDGNHNNSSPGGGGLSERFEVRNSVCRQPRQCCLLTLLGIIAFVLVTATAVSLLMLRAHVAELKAEEYVHNSHGETVADDLNVLLQGEGEVLDLHMYDPTEKSNALSESDADELLHMVENSVKAFSKSSDSYRMKPSDSNEEASYERSNKKWLSKPHKSKTSRLVLSQNKSENVEAAIKEVEEDVLSTNQSHFHLSPADSELPNYDETNHIIAYGFIRQHFYELLVNRLNLTVLDANEGLVLLENKTMSPEKCHPMPRILCNGAYEYRSLDGSCNNLRHPTWGKANEPYRRILFPVYEDGISLPRSEAWKENSLPNPREISMRVHIDEYKEDTEATLLLRNWAQFIEHDMLHTASHTDLMGSSCCDLPNEIDYNESECISIRIPPDDHFYKDNGVSCLPVSRSFPHFVNCSLGPREQFNQMTSYIDASNIYGTSSAQSKLLRYGDFGRLKTFHTDDRKSFLPVRSDPNDTCNQLRKDEVSQGHFCFLAGDPDVNKEATLTAIHTIWVRHHNHVAKILSKYNPHWDDERIFQESRKIISAQIQHITYNEFLPEMLPEELLEKATLKLEQHGFFKDYDATVDPTVSNSFTTVFQFTQSMVQGLVKTICSEWKNEDYEQIHKLINNPFMLWTEGKLGSLVRGIISQKAQQVDHYISGQLTHMYNQNQTKSFGTDLAAEIIQRGRDHGLPPYVQWRQSCQFPNVTEFKDLDEIWHNDAMDKISSTYKSVLDVDLFTGMLAEKHLPGGRVGPTIACLMADQFSRLRRGDRFWYEGDIYMKRFSIQQLKELRGTTLARIICDSGEGVKSIALRPMLIASKTNPLVDCSNVPKVSFSLWKEKTNSSDSEKHTENNTTATDDFMHDLSEEWIDSSEEYSQHSEFNHTHHPSSGGNLVNLTSKKIDPVPVLIPGTKRH